MIAKLLSSKLQVVLPHLVSHSQAAFISGRNILQNVMIGAELICLYNRSNSSPRPLIKVDNRKAYDTVHWSFLHDLLVAYKFPQPMVQWLTTCVQTVSYFLLIYGEPTEVFMGQQGLRQGDLLSPLLFVLVMEYLTRMFSAMAKEPGFNFHPMCRRLRLTNLAFADDLLSFVRERAPQCRRWLRF